MKNFIKRLQAKGFVAGFAVCFALFSGILMVANAETITQQITYGVRVMLNGNVIDFPEDSQPFVMDGRTFLPLRAMADLMDLEVDFDPAANMAILEGAQTQTPAIGGTEANTAEGEAIEQSFVGNWDWLDMPFYVFNADGTGTIPGFDIIWSASGGILYICSTPDLCGNISDCILPDRWIYSFSGNQMVLESLDIPDFIFTYTRR
ncbi:MAG: copper amine oxidase N-terminal domain-containing protein [Defluviitaleaceae bacterium]|nr:copper amine oxidase N-terminal domain-containing protein [Defluviitaleaceae bacterium]